MFFNYLAYKFLSFISLNTAVSIRFVEGEMLSSDLQEANINNERATVLSVVFMSFVFCEADAK